MKFLCHQSPAEDASGVDTTRCIKICSITMQIDYARWQQCCVIRNKTQTLCVIRCNLEANCINRQSNCLISSRVRRKWVYKPATTALAGNIAADDRAGVRKDVIPLDHRN
jgi:hypothetical protein